MSEMQRNRGIVKRLSTKENAKEVFDKLVADGKIDPKWCEVDERGVHYIDHEDYAIVNGAIFDVSGAPDESDDYGDVNEAERLNDTDYKIHAYYYNGGANLSEMLDSSIPKADKEYEQKKSSTDGMKLYVVVLDGDFQRGPGWRRRHIRAYSSEKRAQNYAKTYGGKVVEFGEV